MLLLFVVRTFRGHIRRRCEYNIKMELKEIGFEAMDWIHLDQEPTVSMFVVQGY
jgi:hypothetical protein